MHRRSRCTRLPSILGWCGLGWCLLTGQAAAQQQFGDFTYYNDGGAVTITDYTGTGGEVAIPGTIAGRPVRLIGNRAFRNKSAVTSVTIPDSVTSIGEGVFRDCRSLTSVTLGRGVDAIGESAFEGCSSLVNVTIPARVRLIGLQAFDGCTSLTGFEVAADNVSFRSMDGVLLNRTASTLLRYPAGKTGSYVIPDGVFTLESHAFWGCAGLTGVTLPDSLTSIGAVVFAHCTGLTRVTLPAGVISLGPGAFASCATLRDIETAADHPAFRSVEGILFSKEGTTLVAYPAGRAGAYTVPDDLTTIGAAAFKGSLNLTAVVIPDGVTTIRREAFENCTHLASVTIGRGVTVIGAQAFEDCASLAEVTIPESVTTLGNDVFQRCTSLVSATIGGRVTSVGENVFSYCTDLTSVSLGNDITTLGEGMFRGCKGLTSVTIPDSVASIEFAAFSGCASLTNVTLPGRLTSIEWRTFEGCTSLASIDIPAGVVSIGGEAFSGCASLTRVTVPGGVTAMQPSAFEECSALLEIAVSPDNPALVSVDGVLFNKNQTTLWQYPGGKPGGYVIPASVTSIGYRAFRGCSGLTGVAVHGGVGIIGSLAFSKCPTLLEIAVSPDNPAYLGVDGVLFNKDRTILLQYPGSKPGAYDIPAGLTTIAGDAFRECHGLTRVTIPDSVTRMDGGGIFANCTALQEIAVSPDNPGFFSVDGVLFRKSPAMLLQYPAGKVGGYAVPDGVGLIGERAFSHCAGLTGVTLPGSVTRIDTEAFEDCTGLTHVTIPAGVTWLGADVFQRCANLSSAIFMGDAPTYVNNRDRSFDSSASGFTIYYLDSRSGFASPNWRGYRTVALSPSDGVPEIVAVTATPGTFSLVTVGKASRTYRVERRPDLATGPWSTIATAGPLAADQMLDLTDPAAPTGQAFYRVVETAP